MDAERQLVCDRPAAGVRVVRFIRPDVRPQLYDADPIADCSLYKELRSVALDHLAAGEAIVLNLGLIDWFPTAFYQLLVQAHRDTQARGARLVLCCMTPNVRECFTLMRGDKVFEVRETESRAVNEVKRHG